MSGIIGAHLSWKGTLATAEYTVYRGKRRRRWPYFIGAALVVLAALIAWQVLAVPRVSAVAPGHDAFVRQDTFVVTLDVKGLEKLKDVRVTLDGRDVTDGSSRAGNQLSFTANQLSDGEHLVRFSAASANLLRREVGEEWRFTVDTVVPDLEFEPSLRKGFINSAPPAFKGSTEPQAVVTVTSGALKASAVAGDDGSYVVAVPLPDGPSTANVAVADRAGNTTSKVVDVFVDAVPPTLVVTQLPETLAEGRIRVAIRAADQLGTPSLNVLLDGKEQRVNKNGAKRILKAQDLAQGEHILVVTATDKGGNVVRDKQTFIVDSTERFGSEAMWPGARGKDVKQLQKHLADAGLYSGARTGIYDGKTVAAVKKYQAKYGFTVDGRLEGDTLMALGGQVVVDLGDLHLYLYRGDKLYRSYRIAVGQPAYPTPTGSFVVVNKQVDPTWIPPDSDWARGAEPIPPGPDNPLGTRWIGLSYPGVGIHGTPDDASIGSYASHGCIRMHIPDVEDLYERVVVGMPVLIRP